MKKLTCSILLLAALVGWAFSQQASKFKDTPATANFLFDDDGGRVQIVPPGMAAAGEKTFHRGEVMKSVQQASIFLGSGWGDSANRSREAVLSDLMGSGGGQSADLQKHNIGVLPAHPAQEDFSDLGKNAINDLAIQRKLSEMVESKSVPAPSATTVFVVFLAPEVSSSLGGHKAGKDYVAYHNFVHLDSGQVRYVVVPFDANVDRQRAAATRALVETALNPGGNGWY